jgi:hypothetical protein
VAGVATEPSRLEPVPPTLALREEGEPCDCLLFRSLPPLATAFCKSGLADGENGDPPMGLLAGVSLPERGELEYEELRLPGVPLREVDDRGYRGGVTYCDPGFSDEGAFGSRPRRAR